MEALGQHCLARAALAGDEDVGAALGKAPQALEQGRDLVAGEEVVVQAAAGLACCIGGFVEGLEEEFLRAGFSRPGRRGTDRAAGFARCAWCA